MSISHMIMVMAMAVSGCASAGGQSSDSSSTDPSEQPADSSSSNVIELRYDETVAYQELEIRWLNLEDSRCPTGITCVWGGQMLATIEIVHNEKGKKEVELLRRAAREPEVSNAFGYELRLQDVIPYPKANVEPKRIDYMMRLQISLP